MQSYERTDRSTGSSEYEKDRVAWNLPMPRRALSAAWSESLEPGGDEDDDAEMASLELAA